jgi:hypothetical protein
MRSAVAHFCGLLVGIDECMQAVKTIPCINKGQEISLIFLHFYGHRFIPQYMGAKVKQANDHTHTSHTNTHTCTYTELARTIYLCVHTFLIKCCFVSNYIVPS